MSTHVKMTGDAQDVSAALQEQTSVGTLSVGMRYTSAARDAASFMEVLG